MCADSNTVSRLDAADTSPLGRYLLASRRRITIIPDSVPSLCAFLRHPAIIVWIRKALAFIAHLAIQPEVIHGKRDTHRHTTQPGRLDLSAVLLCARRNTIYRPLPPVTKAAECGEQFIPRGGFMPAVANQPRARSPADIVLCIFSRAGH